LIAALSRPGDRVLDPFCGSGTVLIEAMVQGRVAVGTDLSPLALRISEQHCALRGEGERQRFALALEQVTEASLARVRARTRVRARPPARERALYDPHVLLELVGLLEEIAQVQPEADRRALELVFSTLLVKFSHKRADSSPETAIKRIRKGLCSEFFLRKGRELVQRWAALRDDAAASARAPLLRLGDARELPELLAEQKRFDLVLTSPPYGGTYDYHAQQALRFAWLRLDASKLERAEMGARRDLSQAQGGAQRWDDELGACLRAIAAVCKPDARIVLLLGDAQVGRDRIDAGAQLAQLAPRAGLEPVASAAQARMDYRGGPERKEHLVMLRRAPGARSAALAPR
jgi:16S rRNA G966 N2-methylase RsmD